jgi:hypothetical protein
MTALIAVVVAVLAHWHSAEASWYGPADSGGLLACTEGPLTNHTLGVANKALPCGTRLMICSRRCRVVPGDRPGTLRRGQELRPDRRHCAGDPLPTLRRRGPCVVAEGWAMKLDQRRCAPSDRLQLFGVRNDSLGLGQRVSR